jgi:hypothetical protein
MSFRIHASARSESSPADDINRAVSGAGCQRARTGSARPEPVRPDGQTDGQTRANTGKTRETGNFAGMPVPWALNLAPSALPGSRFAVVQPACGWAEKAREAGLGRLVTDPLRPVPLPPGVAVPLGAWRPAAPVRRRHLSLAATMNTTTWADAAAVQSCWLALVDPTELLNWASTE